MGTEGEKIKKTVLFNKKDDCCGCGACANVCPKGAINLFPDENGFIYPSVDDEKCINCGLCQKTCKFLDASIKNSVKNTYVALTRDTDLKESASGGVFASIAKNVIERGGIIYGCSLIVIDGNLLPMHIRVDAIEALHKLQGSKYIQSFVGQTYKMAKRDLDSNKEVLFSGTPCQIAGLYGVLQKNYSKLTTIELICHGVPSAEMFMEYVRNLENKYRDKAIEFIFRDKTIGQRFAGKILFKNSYKIIYGGESTYYSLFLSSDTYRDSCYTCVFAGNGRVADFTIGDYWGIEKEHPELCETEKISINEGISCLLVNTKKGEEKLKIYGRGLKLWQSSFEKAARANHQLKYPSTRRKDREEILIQYRKGGWQEVERWYLKKKWLSLFKLKIKRFLGMRK